MDENQLRDKIGYIKTSDISILPISTEVNRTLLISSNINSDSLDLVNFLAYMTTTLLESYDPQYAEITEDQWPEICPNCDRNISLVEGIKNPQKVCSRTKWDFSYSRPATKDDLSFSWYRFFVVVADWANGIPQFRMLSDNDQAQLLRLNFTTLSVIVFLHFLTKLNLDPVRIPVGNGSYIDKEKVGR